MGCRGSAGSALGKHGLGWGCRRPLPLVMSGTTAPRLRLAAPSANRACQNRRRPHLPNAFPKPPLLGASPNSPCTWAHLARPGGSRRQVSMADTALVMDAASPFSCQKN